MSYARFQVGDKSGSLLAELEASIGSISWRISNVGKVKFSQPITDGKAIEDYHRFGNKVLIEFDNGLPNWGGVIEPPRSWDGSNLQSTAYSGEYLLKFRQTDRGRYFDDVPVGEILTSLINEANAASDMGIELGDIWEGGSTHSPDYHFKNLFDIVQKSLTQRLSTADFHITAENVGGVITFSINLYEEMGTNKAGIALVEGENLKSMKLQQQGPIVNWWDLAGSGSGWGDDRIIANAFDQASIDVYGLREESKIYSDVERQETLDRNAENLLEQTKNPYNIFTPTVADKEPGQFSEYDLGDRITLQAPSYGFDGTDTLVKVLTREYNPATGFCSLVVQEVL